MPFHIHFSDIAYANRNETKHLPYGEGTLRAEPLRDALARFERPATVISESPDAESTQAIAAVLLGRERGQPLLVDRRFVVATAVAEELDELPEREPLGRAEVIHREPFDGLDHQLLGLVVAPLRRAHEPERELRRRDGDAILGADGHSRLEREPLRFVELPRSTSTIESARCASTSEPRSPRPFSVRTASRR